MKGYTSLRTKVKGGASICGEASLNRPIEQVFLHVIAQMRVRSPTPNRQFGLISSPLPAGPSGPVFFFPF